MVSQVFGSVQQRRIIELPEQAEVENTPFLLGWGHSKAQMLLTELMF